MILIQKLVDETQMPKPHEYTDNFISTKKLFLVGLLGLQNTSNPVERPCKYILCSMDGGKRHVSIFQSQKNGFTSISQIGFCQKKVAGKQWKSSSVQVFFSLDDTFRKGI